MGVFFFLDFRTGIKALGHNRFNYLNTDEPHSLPQCLTDDDDNDNVGLYDLVS